MLKTRFKELQYSFFFITYSGSLISESYQKGQFMLLAYFYLSHFHTYVIYINGNFGLGMCVRWRGGWGWRGKGERHTFITTFMKSIQFCILTGNEKESSSQIYQTRAQTVFILTTLSNQYCVLVILMQEIFPKEKGN